MRLKQRNIHPYNNVNVVGLRHGVFFFRFPITVKKYIMAARMQAVSRHMRLFLFIVGIYTIWLFQFVICPINDYNICRFKQFLDRFLKYLFSLYYDRWSNKLSTVCILFSWHLCLKDIGQNVEYCVFCQ